MSEKYQEVLKSVFSICTMISIFGGFAVCILFVIAIIMGGESGGSLAVLASKSIMPYIVKITTVAVMAGLLMFYSTGEHAFSLKSEQKSK